MCCGRSPRAASRAFSSKADRPSGRPSPSRGLVDEAVVFQAGAAARPARIRDLGWRLPTVTLRARSRRFAAERRIRSATEMSVYSRTSVRSEKTHVMDEERTCSQVSSRTSARSSAAKAAASPSARATTPMASPSAPRSPATAAASPWSPCAPTAHGSAFTVDVSNETLVQDHARRMGSAPDQSRARAEGRRRTGRAYRLGARGRRRAGSWISGPMARAAACCSSCRRTLAPYVAPKGSVALDGTSLTVNEVAGQPLRRQSHPRDLDPDHLGAQKAAATRSMSRSTSSRATWRASWSFAA